MWWVGKSAGLSFDLARGDQAWMLKRWMVSQIRATVIAMISVGESPLVIAARALLLSTYSHMQLFVFLGAKS